MIGAVPAIWVKYRGEVDPSDPPTTTYNYQATLYSNGTNVILYSGNYRILGPAQLSKKNYMEISWSPCIGMNRVAFSLGSIVLYSGRGAECGFRDEGQFINNRGETNNQ